MLQLKIKEKNTIDSTGKLVYITDDTGTVTVDNTQYGGLNPNRNTLALYLIGNIIGSDGSKSLLTVKPYNPATVTNWSVEVPKDGYLQFVLYAFPSASSIDPQALTAGTIIYNTTVGQLYRVIELPVVGSGNITPMNDIEKVLVADVLNSSSYNSFAFDEFFIANSSLNKIDLNKRISDLYLNNENQSTSRDIKYLQEEYNKVRSILEAALYQFCIGNKYQAAKFVEFLQTNNYIAY